MPCLDLNEHALENNDFPVSFLAKHRNQHQQECKLEYNYEFDLGFIEPFDLFNKPNDWSGGLMQKSSDESNMPCWTITGVLLFDVNVFELHRNKVKMYPSEVTTLWISTSYP